MICSICLNLINFQPFSPHLDFHPPPPHHHLPLLHPPLPPRHAPLPPLYHHHHLHPFIFFTPHFIFIMHFVLLNY